MRSAKHSTAAPRTGFTPRGMRGAMPRPSGRGLSKEGCKNHYNHHAQTSQLAHEVSIEQQAIQPGSKIATPQQTSQPSPQSMQQAPPTALLSEGAGPERSSARARRSPSREIWKGAVEARLARPSRETFILSSLTTAVYSASRYCWTVRSTLPSGAFFAE